MKRVSDEVYYSEDPIVKLDLEKVELLKRLAQGNPRKRVRICAHPDADSLLHEMIIVHARDTYVPPHKHVEHPESFHIVYGEIDVYVFEEDGGVKEVIPMGTFESGKNFFYRVPKGVYHSLIVNSDCVVFHETTGGPFERSNMVFAKWGPGETTDVKKISDFQERLKKISAGDL